MTPTRKSGRQPKPSTKLKEFLYDSEIDKAKDSAPQGSEKKKPQATKEPVSRVTEKKKAAAVAKEPPRMPEKRKGPQGVKEPVDRKPEEKIGQVKKEQASRVVDKRKPGPVKKEPEVRAGEKRKISQVTKESPDSSTPSRKSRRTPKPSAKLEEFLYEDDKEKSMEPVPGKRTLKSAEKPKVAVKIKEEPLEDSGPPIKKQVKKLAVDKRLDVQPQVVLNKLPSNESSVKKGKPSANITSPRARVANLTSLSKKKERNAASSSHLSVMKGKVVRVKNMMKAERTVTNIASANRRKETAVKSSAVPGKGPSKLLKRKRELEVNSSKANKKIKKTPDSAKSSGKDSRLANQNKEGKSKVEKKEIEKVLHVNKEVMTQLLNFGAEVAEAMACNNESIFSFSTKDNPLQTFKIDKQDDFSDEEVVKIIKWFEEEEEQRRAYRKRILEALRASHETNMSLYTQMLKMLQSVTAC